MLFERIISAAVGIVALIIIINFVDIKFFPVFVTIVALIGFHEYFTAVIKGNKSLKYLISLLGVGYIFNIYYISSNRLELIYIIFSLIIIVLICITRYQMVNFNEITYFFFGFFYIFVLLSYIILLRFMDNGKWCIWYALISVWVNDSFAYFIGTKYGKRRLIPKISPNKTIEGALGGILGCIIITTVYFVSIYGRYFLSKAIFIGFVVSIFAQVGDLMASTIKREVGIKDFGKIFPGHGGIIDRLDSILFTAPAIYYILLLLS